MIEFLIAKFSRPRFLTMVLAAVAAIATVLTLAMPLLATNTCQADEGGVGRAREDPPARARAPGARREGHSAAVAEAVHAADRRPVQPDQMAGQEEAVNVQSSPMPGETPNSPAGPPLPTYRL